MLPELLVKKIGETKSVSSLVCCALLCCLFSPTYFRFIVALRGVNEDVYDFEVIIFYFGRFKLWMEMIELEKLPEKLA